jgi:uncharacterized protein (TIGR02145 family)
MKNRFLIYQVVVSVLILFLTTDCKKNENTKLADLFTLPVTNFTTETAKSGGNISYNGGSEIFANGVCWSTTVNPVITDSKTVDSIGITKYVSRVSGLTASTTYHIRAYATNSAGTAYGNDLTFTTLSLATVSDIDGNIYNIITIGDQVWMAENLKSTRYRNGDLIGTTKPSNLDISAEDSPRYQWAPYGNENNVATYGRLYTWYVGDTGNLCPVGWHIPTNMEWTTLSFFLGSNNISANKLRETGTAHWAAPNAGATNESGFTALPGGYRDKSGSFSPIGEVAQWWSFSYVQNVKSSSPIPPESRTLAAEFSIPNINYWTIYNGNLLSHADGNGSFGFSIRCLRD